MDSEAKSSRLAGSFGPRPTGLRATTEDWGFSEGSEQGPQKDEGSVDHRQGQKTAKPSKWLLLPTLPQTQALSGSVPCLSLSCASWAPSDLSSTCPCPSLCPSRLFPCRLCPSPNHGACERLLRLVATSFSFLLVVALALSRTSACSSLVALLLPALLRLVSLLPTVVTEDVTEGSSGPREVAKSKLLLVVRETLPESVPVVAFSVENHVLANLRAEALQWHRTAVSFGELKFREVGQLALGLGKGILQMPSQIRRPLDSS